MFERIIYEFGDEKTEIDDIRSYYDNDYDQDEYNHLLSIFETACYVPKDVRELIKHESDLKKEKYVFDRKFKTNCAKLKDYITYDYVEDLKYINRLSIWINKLNDLKQKGELSKEYIDILNDISPIWNNVDELMKMRHDKNVKFIISSKMWENYIYSDETSISVLNLPDEELYNCITNSIFSCEKYIDNLLLSKETDKAIEMYSILLSLGDNSGYVKFVYSIYINIIHIRPSSTERLNRMMDYFNINNTEDIISFTNKILNMVTPEQEIIIRNILRIFDTDIAIKFNSTRELLKYLRIESVDIENLYELYNVAIKSAAKNCKNRYI